MWSHKIIQAHTSQNEAYDNFTIEKLIFKYKMYAGRTMLGFLYYFAGASFFFLKIHGCPWTAKVGPFRLVHQY